MDPLLSLLKIYFKSKNHVNDDESIDIFFENGNSFPQLVSYIFGIGQIPNIQQNPKTLFHKNANNDIALQYLFQNNDIIRKYNPNLRTQNERSNLLYIILTQICFKVNIQEIIDKSNILLKDFDIHSKKDLINPILILKLLNVLTDNKVQIESSIDPQNFNTIMSRSFEIANVPFFINYESMKINNQNFFIIQIQLIFDSFSEKINDLIKKEDKYKEIEFKQDKNIDGDKEQNKQNCKISEEMKNSSKKSNFENDESQNSNEQPNLIDDVLAKSNDNQSKSEEISKIECKNDEIFDKCNSNKKSISDEIINDEDEQNHKIKIEYRYCEEERLEEESLLKIINFLSHKFFKGEIPNFSSFNETLKNDFIPKFVMKILEISSIENVDLSLSIANSDKLTNKNINNIWSVINFLKKQRYEYHVLLFSFSKQVEREASAKLFFKTFLNLFFVKYSRNEMKERLKIIESNSNDSKSVSKNSRYDLIIQSMKFLSQEPKKLNPDLSKIYEFCLDVFSIANIFNEQHLLNLIGQDKIYPDSFYYQLQLLFNEWESTSKSFHIAEVFFISLSKIKKINVPRSDIIVSSIKAKRASLDLINQFSSSSLNHETIKTEQKDEITNKMIIEETNENEYKINNDENKNVQSMSLNMSQNSIDEESFIFWNSPDKIFMLENGIFKKRNSSEKTYEYQELINTEFKNLLSTNDHHKDKSSYIFKNPQKNSDFSTKLYKFFYYDETDKKWKFDNQSFDEFSNAKQINISDSMTPLVFFANSNEEDSISICSHFLLGQNPNINEEEQIFVYAICEKNLTMLNINIDLKNQEKTAIKPIFLLLHIPKSKQSILNLPTIIMQIQIFLYCISDLAIVIISENTFYSQITSTSFIYSIAQENALQNKEIADIKEYKDENDEVHNYNEKFINEKLETIFLFKNENCDFDPELSNTINNNSKYNKMISEFHIRPKITTINIKDINTYESFLNSMTNILMNSKTRFLEVKNKFNCLSMANISTRYINYKITNDVNQIPKMIQDRMLSLNNNPLFKDNQQKIVAQLYIEMNNFTPQFDSKFQSEVNINLFMLRKSTSHINREFFISELNTHSTLNFNKIKNLIKNKHYLSKDQTERIIRNHQKFLQKEFFAIIKSKCDDSIFTIVYDDNSDILKEQIARDKEKFADLFKDINQYIEKRKEIVKFDAAEGSKKQGNYVLKETENLREIKVIVDAGKDLTSVIEQDF